MTFQTDPTVRIALLGITAAGVAVTLTASSTVWFAELFWTPAIMVQAEDRCHRIGQQATVRCLYFIAKGTLDEVLWKLIEKKFRDLGEVISYAFLLSSAEPTANYSSFALNLVRRAKG